MTRSGGCPCGRSRFTLSGTVLHVDHCHCALCRRASGAPVTTWATVAAAQVSWTGLPPAEYRSSAQGLRRFCPACGAKLAFSHADLPDEIDLVAMAFDDPDDLAPGEQIHGESRVSWCAIDPAVPFRSGHEPAEPGAADAPGPLEWLDGGCLCGAHRYRVQGPPLRSSCCHCRTCRRSTGGTLVGWGIWPRSRIAPQGEPGGRWDSSATGTRRFCLTCGATTAFESRQDPDAVAIPLASLGRPARIPPEAHVHAAAAVRWLVVDDTVPRFGAGHLDGEPDDALLR